jgi:methionyl-tRNA formyltransferase
MSRLTVLAVDVLKRSLPLIATQTAKRTGQNINEATYFGGRSQKDSLIDWSNSAIDIHNLVRALQPTPQYPGAFGDVNGIVHTIIKSMIVENASANIYNPGTVIKKFNETTYHIACGQGGDEVLCVIAEIKEAMSH